MVFLDKTYGLGMEVVVEEIYKIQRLIMWKIWVNYKISENA
jgi:hypothetical protein